MSQRPLPFRVISCLILVCFLTTHLPQAGSAQNLPETRPSQKAFKSLETFELFQKLGKVQEQSLSGNQTVILIQDAHSIPEAQKNIQEIIDYLQKDYGIRQVALEGASGELKTQLFNSFPDKEKLKGVLEEYAEKGELAGGIAAALLNETPSVYRGVEDWKLYEKSLWLFSKAMQEEAALIQDLQKKRTHLENQKEKIYSLKLLGVDRALRHYAQDPQNLSEVLQTLASIQAPKPNTEIAYLLEHEHKNVIASPDPGQGHKKRGGARQSRELQTRKFLEEFEAYSKQIKESLFQSQKERDLDHRSRELDLLEKLIKLELTREEWKVAKEIPASAGMTGEAFYRNALEREKVLFEKLFSLTRTSSRPLPQGEGKGEGGVILVAGGFHTQGLIHEFQEHNLSYILITPALTEIPEESFYQNQMQGSLSWKDYFELKYGRINFYEAFVRATRDRLLQKSRPFVLKHWRDQVIRDLHAKRRISESRDYLRFLDEVSEKQNAHVRKKWLANIDQFIQKLQSLQSQNQLTETNVLNLLGPATTPTSTTAVLTGKSDARIEIYPSLFPQAPAQSESRAKVESRSEAREQPFSRRAFLRASLAAAGMATALHEITEGVYAAEDPKKNQVFLFFYRTSHERTFQKMRPELQRFLDRQIMAGKKVVFFQDLVLPPREVYLAFKEKLSDNHKMQLFGKLQPSFKEFKEAMKKNTRAFERLASLLNKKMEEAVTEKEGLYTAPKLLKGVASLRRGGEVARFLYSNRKYIQTGKLRVVLERFTSFLDWRDYQSALEAFTQKPSLRTKALFGPKGVEAARLKAHELSQRFLRYYGRREDSFVSQIHQAVGFLSGPTSAEVVRNLFHAPGLTARLKKTGLDVNIRNETDQLPGKAGLPGASQAQRDAWLLKMIPEMLGTDEMQFRIDSGETVTREQRLAFEAIDVLRDATEEMLGELRRLRGGVFINKTLFRDIYLKIRSKTRHAKDPRVYVQLLGKIRKAYDVSVKLWGRTMEPKTHRFLAVLQVFDRENILDRNHIIIQRIRDRDTQEELLQLLKELDAKNPLKPEPPKPPKETPKSEPPPTSEKSGSLVPIVVGGSVLLLTGAVTAAVLYSKRSKKKTPVERQRKTSEIGNEPPIDEMWGFEEAAMGVILQRVQEVPYVLHSEVEDIQEGVYEFNVIVDFSAATEGKTTRKAIQLEVGKRLTEIIKAIRTEYPDLRVVRQEGNILVHHTDTKEGELLENKKRLSFRMHQNSKSESRVTEPLNRPTETQLLTRRIILLRETFAEQATSAWTSLDREKQVERLVTTASSELSQLLSRFLVGLNAELPSPELLREKRLLIAESILALRALFDAQDMHDFFGEHAGSAESKRELFLGLRASYAFIETLLIRYADQLKPAHVDELLTLLKIQSSFLKDLFVSLQESYLQEYPNLSEVAMMDMQEVISSMAALHLDFVSHLLKEFENQKEEKDRELLISFLFQVAETTEKAVALLAFLDQRDLLQGRMANALFAVSVNFPNEESETMQFLRSFQKKRGSLQQEKASRILKMLGKVTKHASDPRTRSESRVETNKTVEALLQSAKTELETAEEAEELGIPGVLLFYQRTLNLLKRVRASAHNKPMTHEQEGWLKALSTRAQTASHHLLLREKQREKEANKIWDNPLVFHQFLSDLRAGEEDSHLAEVLARKAVIEILRQKEDPAVWARVEAFVQAVKQVTPAPIAVFAFEQLRTIFELLESQWDSQKLEEFEIFRIESPEVLRALKQRLADEFTQASKEKKKPFLALLLRMDLSRYDQMGDSYRSWLLGLLKSNAEAFGAQDILEFVFNKYVRDVPFDRIQAKKVSLFLRDLYREGILSTDAISHFFKRTLTERKHRLDMLQLLAGVLFQVRLESLEKRKAFEKELFSTLGTLYPDLSWPLQIEVPDKAEEVLLRSVSFRPHRARAWLMPYDPKTHDLDLQGKEAYALVFYDEDTRLGEKTLRTGHFFGALYQILFYETEDAFILGDVQSDSYRKIKNNPRLAPYYQDWRWQARALLEAIARAKGKKLILSPRAEAIETLWEGHISSPFASLIYEEKMGNAGYAVTSLHPPQPWFSNKDRKSDPILLHQARVKELKATDPEVQMLRELFPQTHRSESRVDVTARVEALLGEASGQLSRAQKNEKHRGPFALFFYQDALELLKRSRDTAKNKKVSPEQKKRLDAFLKEAEAGISRRKSARGEKRKKVKKLLRGEGNLQKFLMELVSVQPDHEAAHIFAQVAAKEILKPEADAALFARVESFVSFARKRSAEIRSFYAFEQLQALLELLKSDFDKERMHSFPAGFDDSQLLLTFRQRLLEGAAKQSMLFDSLYYLGLLLRIETQNYFALKDQHKAQLVELLKTKSQDWDQEVLLSHFFNRVAKEFPRDVAKTKAASAFIRDLYREGILTTEGMSHFLNHSVRQKKDRLRMLQLFSDVLLEVRLESLEKRKAFEKELFGSLGTSYLDLSWPIQIEVPRDQEAVSLRDVSFRPSQARVWLMPFDLKIHALTTQNDTPVNALVFYDEDNRLDKRHLRKGHFWGAHYFVFFYERGDTLVTGELENDQYRRMLNDPDLVKTYQDWRWQARSLLEAVARAKGKKRIISPHAEHVETLWGDISSTMTSLIYEQGMEAAGYQSQELSPPHAWLKNLGRPDGRVILEHAWVKELKEEDPEVPMLRELFPQIHRSESRLQESAFREKLSRLLIREFPYLKEVIEAKQKQAGALFYKAVFEHLRKYMKGPGRQNSFFDFRNLTNYIKTAAQRGEYDFESSPVSLLLVLGAHLLIRIEQTSDEAIESLGPLFEEVQELLDIHAQLADQGVFSSDNRYSIPSLLHRALTDFIEDKVYLKFGSQPARVPLKFRATLIAIDLIGKSNHFRVGGLDDADIIVSVPRIQAALELLELSDDQVSAEDKKMLRRALALFWTGLLSGRSANSELWNLDPRLREIYKDHYRDFIDWTLEAYQEDIQGRKKDTNYVSLAGYGHNFLTDLLGQANRSSDFRGRIEDFYIHATQKHQGFFHSRRRPGKAYPTVNGVFYDPDFDAQYQAALIEMVRLAGFVAEQGRATWAEVEEDQRLLQKILAVLSASQQIGLYSAILSTHATEESAEAVAKQTHALAQKLEISSDLYPRVLENSFIDFELNIGSFESQELFPSERFFSVSSNGKYLFASPETELKGTLLAYERGAPQNSVKKFEAPPGIVLDEVVAVTMHHPNEVTVFYKNGTVAVWDFESATLQKIKQSTQIKQDEEKPFPILTATVSPDGQFIVVANELELRLFETNVLFGEGEPQTFGSVSHESEGKSFKEVRFNTQGELVIVRNHEQERLRYDPDEQTWKSESLEIPLNDDPIPTISPSLNSSGLLYGVHWNSVTTPEWSHSHVAYRAGGEEAAPLFRTPSLEGRIISISPVSESGAFYVNLLSNRPRHFIPLSHFAQASSESRSNASDLEVLRELRELLQSKSAFDLQDRMEVFPLHGDYVYDDDGNGLLLLGSNAVGKSLLVSKLLGVTEEGYKDDDSPWEYGMIDDAMVIKYKGVYFVTASLNEMRSLWHREKDPMTLQRTSIVPKWTGGPPAVALLKKVIIIGTSKKGLAESQEIFSRAVPDYQGPLKSVEVSAQNRLRKFRYLRKSLNKEFHPALSESRSNALSEHMAERLWDLKSEATQELKVVPGFYAADLTSIEWWGQTIYYPQPKKEIRVIEVQTPDGPRYLATLGENEFVRFRLAAELVPAFVSDQQDCNACIAIGKREGEPVVVKFHALPEQKNLRNFDSETKVLNGQALLQALSEVLEGLEDVTLLLSPRLDQTTYPSLEEIQKQLGEDRIRAVRVFERPEDVVLGTVVDSKGVAFYAYRLGASEQEPTHSLLHEKLISLPNVAALAGNLGFYAWSWDKVQQLESGTESLDLQNTPDSSLPYVSNHNGYRSIYIPLQEEGRDVSLVLRINGDALMLDGGLERQVEDLFDYEQLIEEAFKKALSFYKGEKLESYHLIKAFYDGFLFRRELLQQTGILDQLTELPRITQSYNGTVLSFHFKNGKDVYVYPSGAIKVDGRFLLKSEEGKVDFLLYALDEVLELASGIPHFEKSALSFWKTAKERFLRVARSEHFEHPGRLPIAIEDERVRLSVTVRRSEFAFGPELIHSGIADFSASGIRIPQGDTPLEDLVITLKGELAERNYDVANSKAWINLKPFTVEDFEENLEPLIREALLIYSDLGVDASLVESHLETILENISRNEARTQKQNEVFKSIALQLSPAELGVQIPRSESRKAVRTLVYGFNQESLRADELREILKHSVEKALDEIAEGIQKRLLHPQYSEILDQLNQQKKRRVRAYLNKLFQLRKNSAPVALEVPSLSDDFEVQAAFEDYETILADAFAGKLDRLVISGKEGKKHVADFTQALPGTAVGAEASLVGFQRRNRSSLFLIWGSGEHYPQASDQIRPFGARFGLNVSREAKQQTRLIQVLAAVTAAMLIDQPEENKRMQKELLKALFLVEAWDSFPGVIYSDQNHFFADGSVVQALMDYEFSLAAQRAA